MSYEGNGVWFILRLLDDLNGKKQRVYITRWKLHTLNAVSGVAFRVVDIFFTTPKIQCFNKAPLKMEILFPKISYFFIEVLCSVTVQTA